MGMAAPSPLRTLTAAQILPLGWLEGLRLILVHFQEG